MVVTDIIWVALLAFSINLMLGLWGRKYKKFTLPWWLMIHASVPIIIVLRIFHHIPNIFIPLFIIVAVVGQWVGKKYIRE